MFSIIKSSIYKLFRDRTFQVTAIIVLAVAALMMVIGILTKRISGDSTFLTCVSSTSGVGLTVPINLIVFTVGEFTYGTIRNKLIAGFSKTKVYIGLFITGLIFTFILMGLYISISLTISSSIGGFNPNNIGGLRFVFIYLAYAIAFYVFTTALSVFIGTLIRAIGGSITIDIVLLVVLSLLPLMVFNNEESIKAGLDHWSSWVNPGQMIGFYSNDVMALIARLFPGLSFFYPSVNQIIAGIATPLYWAAILFFGGLYIFNKSDVK